MSEGKGFLCLVISLVPLMIVSAIAAAGASKFVAIKTTCYIVNATYPKHIPSDPDQIRDEFTPCDCGRHCTSDLGYCVRIYVAYENATYMAYQTVQNQQNIECTFYEDTCINGEQLSDRIEALDHAEAVAQPFTNTSSQIDCYQYDGNFFLNNNAEDYIIWISVLGTLSLMLIMTGIYYLRGSNSKLKTNADPEQPPKPVV